MNVQIRVLTPFEPYDTALRPQTIQASLVVPVDVKETFDEILSRVRVRHTSRPLARVDGFARIVGLLDRNREDILLTELVGSRYSADEAKEERVMFAVQEWGHAEVPEPVGGEMKRKRVDEKSEKRKRPKLEPTSAESRRAVRTRDVGCLDRDMQQREDGSKGLQEPRHTIHPHTLASTQDEVLVPNSQDLLSVSTFRYGDYDAPTSAQKRSPSQTSTSRPTKRFLPSLFTRDRVSEGSSVEEDPKEDDVQVPNMEGSPRILDSQFATKESFSGPAAVSRSLLPANEQAATPKLRRPRPSLGNSSSLRRSSGVSSDWTPAEDLLLLQAFQQKLSAAEIVKKYNLRRTVTAVRSRRIILEHKHPNNGLPPLTQIFDRPARSEGKRSSMPELENGEDSDVEELSEGIAAGYDAVELRAMYFSDHSQVWVEAKMESCLPSVLQSERKMDDWPHDNVSSPGWRDEDNLKLRRCFREGLNARDAHQRYFTAWKLKSVRRKIAAYKKQMTGHDVDVATLSEKVGVSSGAPQTMAKERSTKRHSHASHQALAATTSDEAEAIAAQSRFRVKRRKISKKSPSAIRRCSATSDPIANAEIDTGLEQELESLQEAIPAASREAHEVSAVTEATGALQSQDIPDEVVIDEIGEKGSLLTTNTSREEDHESPTPSSIAVGNLPTAAAQRVGDKTSRYPLPSSRSSESDPDEDDKTQIKAEDTEFAEADISAWQQAASAQLQGTHSPSSAGSLSKPRMSQVKPAISPETGPSTPMGVTMVQKVSADSTPRTSGSTPCSFRSDPRPKIQLIEELQSSIALSQPDLLQGTARSKTQAGNSRVGVLSHRLSTETRDSSIDETDSDMVSPKSSAAPGSSREPSLPKVDEHKEQSPEFMMWSPLSSRSRQKQYSTKSPRPPAVFSKAENAASPVQNQDTSLAGKDAVVNGQSASMAVPTEYENDGFGGGLNPTHKHVHGKLPRVLSRKSYASDALKLRKISRDFKSASGTPRLHHSPSAATEQKPSENAAQVPQSAGYSATPPEQSTIVLHQAAASFRDIESYKTPRRSERPRYEEPSLNNGASILAAPFNGVEKSPPLIDGVLQEAIENVAYASQLARLAQTPCRPTNENANVERGVDANAEQSADEEIVREQRYVSSEDESDDPDSDFAGVDYASSSEEEDTNAVHDRKVVEVTSASDASDDDGNYRELRSGNMDDPTEEDAAVAASDHPWSKLPIVPPVMISGGDEEPQSDTEDLITNVVHQLPLYETEITDAKLEKAGGEREVQASAKPAGNETYTVKDSLGAEQTAEEESAEDSDDEDQVDSSIPLPSISGKTLPPGEFPAGESGEESEDEPNGSLPGSGEIMYNDLLRTHSPKRQGRPELGIDDSSPSEESSSDETSSDETSSAESSGEETSNEEHSSGESSRDSESNEDDEVGEPPMPSKALFDPATSKPDEDEPLVDTGLPGINVGEKNRSAARQSPYFPSRSEKSDNGSYQESPSGTACTITSASSSGSNGSPPSRKLQATNGATKAMSRPQKRNGHDSALAHETHSTSSIRHNGNLSIHPPASTAPVALKGHDSVRASPRRSFAKSSPMTKSSTKFKRSRLDLSDLLAKPTSVPAFSNGQRVGEPVKRYLPTMEDDDSGGSSDDSED